MRSAEEMDQADVELRETILKVWSLTGKSKIDLLVPYTPSIGRGRLTVGKIYGGLLILDNWKQTKFGNVRPALAKVRSYRKYTLPTHFHFLDGIGIYPSILT